MKKKCFLDISFSWIFAILVGAIIIIGAVYGVSKFSKIEQVTQTTKGAKEISVLLNPLETSFETGKVTTFILPVESKIYLTCDSSSDFGTQEISLSEKIRGKWSYPSPQIYFSNKYLFSDLTQGKTFYLFSKPFEFPFKAGSLIYLTSSKDTYCFKDASKEINKELENLNQPNIRLEDCEAQDTTVCFEESNCDIEVNDYSLEKQGETFYFQGDALMFAAIFSEKQEYECQVKRLMKRVSTLSEIYLQKANTLSQKGCDSDLSFELQELNDLSTSLEDSSDLNMETLLEELDWKNRYLECKLW